MQIYDNVKIQNVSFVHKSMINNFKNSSNGFDTTVTTEKTEIDQQDSKANPISDKFSAAAGFNELTPVDVYNRTSAFELGRRYARESFDMQPNQKVIDKLTEHLRQIAKESYQGIFDAGKNLHDNLYQSEFERLLARRNESEKGAELAEAKVREKENALALTVNPQKESSLFFWILFAATTLVFGFIIAVTLHDVIFVDIAANDPLMGWFLSFLTGIPIGAVFILLITQTKLIKNEGFNWFGVISGVSAALGLLLIRHSITDSFDALSLGLTLLEIGLIFGLECYANYSRKNGIEFIRSKETYEKAHNEYEAMMKNFNRWNQRLKEDAAAIRKHIQFVENRSVATVYNNSIEESLVTAGVSGYYAQIQENNGIRFK